MARLFISYNHRDAPYAFALRQWLIKEQEWAEHEIFVDAEDLTAGVEWHPKLIAEAESAQVMLFLASEWSLHVDSFCYTEVQSAKGQILVVTLGGVGPDDPRFDKALSRHPSAKARQITPLDRQPVDALAYEAVGDHPAGSAALNRECVESLGRTLRELGVAPNSFSWTPNDEGPFPGLRPLMEGDEAIFRGRDLEIRDGIKALDDLRGTVTERVLLIQAPSGAGKSSFLRAGLWQRLRRHPGFTPLAIVRTEGGAVRHPQWGLVAGLFDTLDRNPELGRNLSLSRAEIASRVGSDFTALLRDFAEADAIDGRRRTLLLGVDQAEEMTVLSPDDDAELRGLLQAVQDLPADLDFRLVLTVRDDSIDATMDRLVSAGLPREAVRVWRLNRLPPNRFDDIIREVEAAANRAGWPLRIDPELVDALAAAAAEGSAGEGGDALPILALALQRLVERHRAPGSGEVALRDETAKDFLEHAVEDKVREAREAVAATEEDLRRLIIPRLATWDPRAGAKGAAKRQVTAAADLFTGERAGLQPLADALVGQRLLTQSGDTYEVAHEALLRVPPLGDLIFARREKFEQVRILEVETREWADSGKASGNLVRSGERLKDAMALLEDPDFGPDLQAKMQGRVEEASAVVAEYLAACGAHEKREADRARKVRRTVTSVLVVLLAAASAAAVFGWWQSEQALEGLSASRFQEGKAWMLRASVAEKEGKRYPDTLLYAAQAIGYDGVGREAEATALQSFPGRARAWWRSISGVGLQLADLFSGMPSGSADDEVLAELHRNHGKLERVELVPWDTLEDLKGELFSVLADSLGLQSSEEVNAFCESLGGTPSKGNVYFNLGAELACENWQILSPSKNLPGGSTELNRFIQLRFREQTIRYCKGQQNPRFKLPKPMGSEQIVYGDKVINVKNHSAPGKLTKAARYPPPLTGLFSILGLELVRLRLGSIRQAVGLSVE